MNSIRASCPCYSARASHFFPADSRNVISHSLRTKRSRRALSRSSTNVSAQKQKANMELLLNCERESATSLYRAAKEPLFVGGTRTAADEQLGIFHRHAAVGRD